MPYRGPNEFALDKALAYFARKNLATEREELLAEISCFMIYSEALLAFRTGGSGRNSNHALQEANRANKHIPPNCFF